MCLSESTPLHIPVRHSPHQQQYDRHHTPGGSPASRSMATPPKQRNRSHGSPHPQQQSPVTPQVYYSNQLDPQLMQVENNTAYRRLGAKGSYLTLVRVADRII